MSTIVDIALRRFSYSVGAVATEVTASVKANHLHRVVHAANANVAHFRVLECLSLAHLATSRIVALERCPVHSKDDAVCSGVDAGLIRPGWNPVHWNTTNVHGATASCHIVTNVVVSELQQAATCC